MIQLKMTSKQLNRMHLKCEKEEAKAKKQVKKVRAVSARYVMRLRCSGSGVLSPWHPVTLPTSQAMESKNIEVARVYAENAIRKKSEGLNYLKMSSRVDGVASRIESVVAMKGVSPSPPSPTGSYPAFDVVRCVLNFLGAS